MLAQVEDSLPARVVVIRPLPLHQALNQQVGSALSDIIPHLLPHALKSILMQDGQEGSRPADHFAVGRAKRRSQHWLGLQPVEQPPGCLFAAMEIVAAELADELLHLNFAQRCGRRGCCGTMTGEEKQEE